MKQHSTKATVHTGMVVTDCPFPVNFDTYWGCSHKCSYCFAVHSTQKAHTGSKGRSEEEGDVEAFGDASILEKYISGKRSTIESWCDWNIPVCIGRNSDPFQPCEARERRTFECLKLLARTGYPFIITTKGTDVATLPEYLAVLKDCNCLLQISMCCSLHDKLEQGAPNYESRLKALEKLSGVCTRTVARWQPLFLEFVPRALREVPRVKDAGAYGILAETAYLHKKTNLCRYFYANHYRYSCEDMERNFMQIKAACHGVGLKFLCSDMKRLSDEMPCCGTKGMDGFVPCRCNTAYAFCAPDEYFETPRMKEKGTAAVLHAKFLNVDNYQKLKQRSFADVIREWCKDSNMKLNMERR